eukprot:9504089-Pyramimonas_sp.AAC.3
MQVLHPFVAPSARDPYWDLVRQRKGRLLKPPEGSLPPAESDQSITHLRRLAERLDMPHVEYRASITSGSFFGEFPFGNAILSRHQLLGVRVLTEQIGNTRRKADRVRDRADLQDRGLLTATVVLPCGAQVRDLALTQCITYLRASLRITCSTLLLGTDQYSTVLYSKAQFTVQSQCIVHSTQYTAHSTLLQCRRRS